MIIGTLNSVKICLFERVKQKPALLLTFREKLQMQWGRALCDGGCLTSGSATSFLQFPKWDDGSTVCVTPGSFPTHSLISDVYIKTNLDGLRAILKMAVENTVRG